MIDLHHWPTPNGKKVTILLEECGLVGQEEIAALRKMLYNQRARPAPAGGLL